MWVAAGILSYLGALTYAEMGAMKPDAGGLYTYIRDAFGPLPGLPLWMDELLRDRERLGGDARRRVLRLLLASSCRVGGIGARLISIGVIVVIAAINVRGTRNSATMQNWTTGAKVAGCSC